MCVGVVFGKVRRCVRGSKAWAAKDHVPIDAVHLLSNSCPNPTMSTSFRFWETDPLTHPSCDDGKCYLIGTSPPVHFPWTQSLARPPWPRPTCNNQGRSCRVAKPNNVRLTLNYTYYTTIPCEPSKGRTFCSTRLLYHDLNRPNKFNPLPEPLRELNEYRNSKIHGIFIDFC